MAFTLASLAATFTPTEDPAPPIEDLPAPADVAAMSIAPRGEFSVEEAIDFAYLLCDPDAADDAAGEPEAVATALLEVARILSRCDDISEWSVDAASAAAYVWRETAAWLAYLEVEGIWACSECGAGYHSAGAEAVASGFARADDSDFLGYRADAVLTVDGFVCWSCATGFDPETNPLAPKNAWAFETTPGPPCDGRGGPIWASECDEMDAAEDVDPET